MMYYVITASPNSDGLTAACAKAVFEGIGAAQGRVEIINISKHKLAPCLICDNGWGQCRDLNACIIDDLLGEIQDKIRKSAGIILVTPVYWGQPSERMKYFLDRFRRCEAFNQAGSALKNKSVILIAAAGGSGNGTLTCLSEMENWCRHLNADLKDRISVSRFNQISMLQAIYDAGKRLVVGEYES